MARRWIHVASLIFVMSATAGCATTQEAVGGAMMAVGAGTSFIAIGDSMDGHPRNHPELISRQADPSADIPIAMAGGVLFIAGGVVYLTSPKHHGTSSTP